jgi:hypothetical protein
MGLTARKRFSKPSELGFSIFGWSNFGAEFLGIAWVPFGSAIFGDSFFGDYLRLSGIYQMHYCREGKFHLRMKFYQPKNPQSPDQQANRGKFGEAIDAWQALTPEEKESYNQKAIGKKMSGYNLFLRECMLDPNNMPIPAGLIAMWSGSLVDIPIGWGLCDGLEGRPDLRSKFLKGSAIGVEPGVEGGATSHDHDAHPILSHAGGAVNPHSAHSGGAVNPHSAHSGGAVADHAAKNAAVADVGATQKGTTASTLTLKAHVHSISAYVHGVTQPAAHSDHVFTQPAAHSDHVFTQPNDHAVQSHSSESNEPVFYSLAFIIKL